MPINNPYQNISGGMQDPLAYLRGEGVGVTGDYAQYFQDYDPSREQAAYQEYGMGQQAAMGGGRANLLAMTQQGGGMGGFQNVGFGGDQASMMRGQFGLQQEQAGMGLRGDIYGMRREQEEDWWSQLSRVEQARGEQFGFSSGNVEPDTPSGGTPLTDQNQYTQVAAPSESGSAEGQVSGSGEWTWNGSSWVPTYVYQGQTGTGTQYGYGGDDKSNYGYSDIRLKNNINYLYSLKNGIPIYSFKYNGSDKLNVGTIAQEAEKIIPESVIENSAGIKLVNYDMIFQNSKN